jgi:ABC-type lipoprotein export system ATPase subunit
VPPRNSRLSKDVVAAAQDIYKIYQTEQLETVALRGVSLDIRQGEILAVIGPAGSGKSTLLGVFGGMIKPTSGEMYWEPRGGISSLHPNEIIKIRRRFIGFVFQEENLIPHLTALQNIELSTRVAGLAQSRERSITLLRRMGLKHRLDFFPPMLSSGERQRVAIASALINNPQLVLADEPTGNVDEATSRDILELIRELNRETGTAFLIVTHSQRVASQAHEIFEIRDGMISGSHSGEVELRNLGKTRLLNLDDRGRVPLPLELLDTLHNPRRFRVNLENGKIVLTPDTESEK